MNVKDEIAERVDKLPPELQEQVLRFVVSLPVSALTGERGAVLLEFGGSLDAVSAEQMMQAINDGCERVDASEW